MKKDKGTSDADAFERAMADVVRLEPDPRGRVRSARPITVPTAPSSHDHVDGPDADTGDFVAPGVDRREIRKLKRGDYAASDQHDLHGMTSSDAVASVGRFLANSRHHGHRCVCIVHGRGLHSAGKTPVLKARVRRYLMSHPSVLAYADAPRSGGGAGAVYVLLRKEKA